MTDTYSAPSVDGRLFDELQAKVLQKSWGWLLALGILFVILGTIGLGRTFAMTVLSVLFFGVLMLVGSGVQLIGAFRLEGWKNILWQIIMALLYALAGIIIVSDPLLASLLITAFLAASIIGVGIMRIVMAFRLRGSPGWMWLLIGGIVSVVMGALIFAMFPGASLWVIGLFVSVEMIVHGWTYIMVALAARRQSKETVQAATG